MCYIYLLKHRESSMIDEDGIALETSNIES